MKIIITGGAGFIGSHLARVLSKKRHIVKIIDNLSTGKIKNIQDLMQLRLAQFIKADIRNHNMLIKEFKNFDAVFHQAAFVSVPKSEAKPEICFDINVNGTKNVLEAARQNSIKKVIFASSCAVYGGIKPGTKAKEACRIKPSFLYAKSKLEGEKLCRLYAEKYGIDIIILRYFNVYGPGQASGRGYGSVVPAFIYALTNGQPPIIYGRGEQMRNFIYVDDVVRANVLALQAMSPAKAKYAGEIFNIGARMASINLLLKTLIKICKCKSAAVKHLPTRPGDISYIDADIAKARETLDFKPSVSLAQGLKICYFKAKLVDWNSLK